MFREKVELDFRVYNVAMTEGQPKSVHHVQLGPGEAIVISAPVPDLGTHHPDLQEELHGLVRRSTNLAIYAQSGRIEDRDDFDGNFGEEVAAIGKSLKEAGIPVQQVAEEVRQVLQHEPHRNIDDKSAEDLTGFYVGSLSYSPKEG